MSKNNISDNPGKSAVSADAAETVKRHSMLDTIGKILKIILPLAVSAVLVIWMFQKIDLKRVWGIISGDCNYFWLLLVMLFTILSHVIRGVRWGIQLRAAGIPRMSVTAESVSIFSAYAINLVVPYLGEAWRCIYVSRRERTKLSTVVGTDFADRISDAVMILSLLGLTLIVAHTPMTNFFDRYKFGETLIHILSFWQLWAGIALAIAIFAICDFIYRDKKFFRGFNRSLARIWTGFVVLFSMKGRWEYFFLTIGIWVCYFLKIYLCFFAFPFTMKLIDPPGYAFGLLPGLVAFVFGSFSMAVPSNGGLGPWNIAVMYALMLYGIGHSDAAAFSIVAWGAQTVMIILLGIFSAFYIAFTRRKNSTGKSAL